MKGQICLIITTLIIMLFAYSFATENAYERNTSIHYNWYILGYREATKNDIHVFIDDDVNWYYDKEFTNNYETRKAFDKMIGYNVSINATIIYDCCAHRLHTLDSWYIID